jgi:signal transduction histidine kinase
MRRRFLRRAVLFFAAVIVFTSVLSSLVQWGTRGMWHMAGAPPGAVPPPGWAMLHALVVVLVVLVLAATFGGPAAFRRMAGPVEDVLAALGRAADGDFSARVPEHGSPEGRTLARAWNTMAERLQRQDEQRRNLFTDISHELRTPLSVLQGTLEGMRDGIYPRDNEHLALSLEETQTLARLVEDLRTLATADSAGLRLTKAPVDLGDLARDVLAAFGDQAAEAGVTLGFAAEPGPAPVVDADAERLRQVLNNLIGNALRYTPRGGTVRIRCYPAGGDRVGLAVEDSGTGISRDDLPHVFDRFYKSKDSRGTGLGLAIVKSLVQAHGGEIAADSEPGRGTSIRIELPRRDAA